MRVAMKIIMLSLAILSEAMAVQPLGRKGRAADDHLTLQGTDDGVFLPQFTKSRVGERSQSLNGSNSNFHRSHRNQAINPSPCSDESDCSHGQENYLSFNRQIAQLNVNVSDHVSDLAWSGAKSNVEQQQHKKNVTSLVAISQYPDVNTLYEFAVRGRILKVNVLMLLLCIAIVRCVNLGPRGYSIVAMILWSVDLFVLCYANVIFPAPVVLLMGKFIVTGIEGAVLHHYFARSEAKYHTELHTVRCMSFNDQLLYYLGPGCSLFVADCAAVLGFGCDLQASGVHGVILVLNPVMVTVFFYFFASEIPTLVQLGGGLLALSGGVMSGIIDTKDQGFSTKEMALLWCTLSMLGYTGVTTFLRLASIKGVSWKTSWVGRCTAMGIGGLALLVMYPFIFKSVPPVTWECVLWSCIIAAADELGLYALVKSFQFPDVVAGVNVAIATSCSVVNVLLGITLLGLHQPFMKYVAAGASFLGTVILTAGS